MSTLGVFALVILAASGYIALLLGRMHDYRRRAQLAESVADARGHTIKRQHQQNLGEMVKTRIAESRQQAAASYARDMERQRDHALARANDMQRRLADATRSVGEVS